MLQRRGKCIEGRGRELIHMQSKVSGVHRASRCKSKHQAVSNDSLLYFDLVLVNCLKQDPM